MRISGILMTMFWIISLTLIYSSALNKYPYKEIMIVMGFLMNGMILFEYFRAVDKLRESPNQTSSPSDSKTKTREKCQTKKRYSRLSINA